jgi:alginate biosynthesis protein AlgX
VTFELCDEAYRVPDERRAHQGFHGWFFYPFDLETQQPLLDRYPLMVRLARALEAQGTHLVVVPIPTRSMVHPDLMNADDPTQAAFSASKAVAAYMAFLEQLSSQDVTVVDVLASARTMATPGDASDVAFYMKRDLHWTTLGAQVVAGAVADALVPLEVQLQLPHQTYVTRRAPWADPHLRGEFVNNWLYEACGYKLPGELVPAFSTHRLSPGSVSAAPVVLAGTSFSIPPYYLGFLSTALQADVLNVSVGAGGTYNALQAYLISRSYREHKPKLLIWEFPIFGNRGDRGQWRQLIPSVYGPCKASDSLAATTARVTGREVPLFQLNLPPAPGHATFLHLQASDLKLTTFGVSLVYQDGFAEMVRIKRSDRVPNTGEYFLELHPKPLKSVALNVADGISGTIDARLCPSPGS